MILCRFLPIAIVLAVNVAATRGDVAAALDAKISNPTLAGIPLRFELTISSTGSDHLSFWNGGPGTYPPGNNFVANFVNAHGASRRVALSNGQGMVGTGYFIVVERPITFPVAAPPLAPGDYTVVIESVESRRPGTNEVLWPAAQSPPLKLTISENAKERVDAVEAIRNSKDPFSRHVYFAYGIDPAVEDLLKRAGNTDPATALDAVQRLHALLYLSSDQQQLLLKAMQQHVKDQPSNLSLISSLHNLIAVVSTNSGDVEIPLALAGGDEVIGRRDGLAILAKVPHSPEIEKVLLEHIRDSDGDARYWAFRGLAYYGNAVAIPSTIAIVRNGPGTGDRIEAINALVLLRGEPEVRAALLEASQFSDEAVQETAKQVLSMPPVKVQPTSAQSAPSLH